MKTSSNTRSIAILLLQKVLQKKQKADVVMNYIFPADMQDRDKHFVHELSYTVLRNYFSLNADVRRYWKKKPDTLIVLALMVGACQIRHMRVPTHAAVAETVEATRKLGKVKACGMVNAVLRRVADSEPIKNLHIHEQLELPKWLFNRWQKQFSIDELKAMAKIRRQTPTLCLALLNNNSTESLMEQGEQGITKHALLLPNHKGSINALPGYDAGDWLVMDQAAQLSVQPLLNIDGCILDMCAAPGGKSILLQSHGKAKQIIAIDNKFNRLNRMLENQQRVKQKSSLLQADATCLPLADASVDAVLLDAPCTASGVIRRHPDAAFLHEEDDIMRLQIVQKNLLDEAIRVLKPGGMLVYAVCSLHKEEGEQVLAEAIINEQLLPNTLPDILQAYSIEKGMARLPITEQHDGFFLASMRRS
ncbi:MAG: transcription antitermination factor NusB [Mariprofundales bacterium]